jgi:hypothetical protein
MEGFEDRKRTSTKRRSLSDSFTPTNIVGSATSD